MGTVTEAGNLYRGAFDRELDRHVPRVWLAQLGGDRSVHAPSGTSAVSPSRPTSMMSAWCVSAS